MHPLDLLCACLWAGQRGQQLGNLHVMALVEPDADLVALMQLAGRHQVTPMLAKGILGAEQSRDLPDDFRFYLRFIHARNEARNSALQRQLGEAAACLNLIGIEPVLLKGAIRLVDGLYPDLGWRLMRDLDLLVPRERLHDAVAQLRRIGYASSSLAAPRRHWHLPPLARAAAEAVIEVHEDLLGRPGLCSAEQMIARSQPTIVDGARARVPVIVDQLVHLIAHDRLDAPFRHARMLFLRSIFEILLLAQSRTIVQEVVGRFALVDLAFWPQAAFGLAAELFPDDATPGLQGMERGLRANLELRLLLGLERRDRRGSMRRVGGYMHARVEELANSAARRRYFMRSLLYASYYRRCCRTLAQLWHEP